MAGPNQTENHANYLAYVVVWLQLLGLTALTVAVAGFDVGYAGILVVLIIAATKSTLVGEYFMHLKYEPPLLRRMVFVVISILAVFIGLTFTDVAFR